MFQLKDFASIAASMINLMRGNTTKITDFNPGSVARTLVEAPALEIEQMYLQMFTGLTEAIPVAIYSAFDFALLPAAYSSGALTFYASGGHAEDIFIAAGASAVNADTGLTYSTTVDATIPVGSTQVSVSAICTTVGYTGDTNALTVTSLSTSITGVTGVTNLTAFSGGRSEETEAERKSRFTDYIGSISRGTNSALEYGAGSAFLTDVNGVVTEKVVFKSAAEMYLIAPASYSTGITHVYIHNGSSGASPTLITRAQEIIDGYYDDSGLPVPGYKASGNKAPVIAATEVAVAVTGTVTAKAGYVLATVIAAAESAVNAYLLGLGIGEDALISEIIRLIKSTEGVYNVTLSLPSADVVIDYNEKAMPGAVSLS